MLVFLKLGGSLITDKTQPYTPRLEIIDTLAGQIAGAQHENADLKLILGHGSGSFGHPPAAKYGTREGVSGDEGWRGFAEVWYRASELNRLVLNAMRNAGLPAITLAPSAVITGRDGKIVSWDLTTMKKSLANSLLPVIYGDVVFDENRGGTILSTEDLFSHLAAQLHPGRILLASLEAGVWKDFPGRKHLIKEMTPQTFPELTPSLSSKSGADVTGGMETKVTEMLALVEKIPGLEVLIFSGEEPNNIRRALQGENPGTRLHC